MIRHAASSARWDTWTRTARVFYLTTCTAPFILSEADVEALLTAIDTERRRRAAT
ncbi:hypothetical protein NKG05_30895 [Oerskovia sp. M15]